MLVYGRGQAGIGLEQADIGREQADREGSRLAGKGAGWHVEGSMSQSLEFG